MQAQRPIRVTMLIAPPHYVEVLQEIFIELGCEVTLLKNTSDLEECILSMKPDLIMVDPGIEDWQALRVMQKHLTKMKEQNTHIAYLYHRHYGSAYRDFLREALFYQVTPFNIKEPKRIFSRAIERIKQSQSSLDISIGIGT